MNRVLIAFWFGGATLVAGLIAPHFGKNLGPDAYVPFLLIVSVATAVIASIFAQVFLDAKLTRTSAFIAGFLMGLAGLIAGCLAGSIAFSASLSDPAFSFGLGVVISYMAVCSFWIFSGISGGLAAIAFQQHYQDAKMDGF
jgi:hypothetical protein